MLLYQYETTAKPGEEPTKYTIYPVKIPADQLGPNWQSVPNFDSCLHGFNILYVGKNMLQSFWAGV